MQTRSPSILADTIAAIGAILGPELDRIAIERVVVGVFFTGVKLGTGSAGACATPIKTIPGAVCCPSSAMAMPFPGKLRGRRAADLMSEALSDHGIRRAVGIAAVAMFHLTFPCTIPRFSVVKEIGHALRPFSRSFP